MAALEPGATVEWTDDFGDYHSGSVETALGNDRYEVVTGWEEGYPIDVAAVEGARLRLSPWGEHVRAGQDQQGPQMPARPTARAVWEEPGGVNATVSDRDSGLAYLLREGDSIVPGSRYGWSTRECAEAAWTAAVQVSHETGFRLSHEDLDHMMGLVVNDDPTVLEYLDDAAEQAPAAPSPRDDLTRPLGNPSAASEVNRSAGRTWFERNGIEPALGERAAKHLYATLDHETAVELDERSGGDRQFALWLHLADEHRGYLPSAASSLEGTDWRQLYESGKSPYGAVIDSWERLHGNQADPAQVMLTAPAPAVSRIDTDPGRAR